DESERARRLREAMGFNGRGSQQKFAELLGVERGGWKRQGAGRSRAFLSAVGAGGGVILGWRAAHPRRAADFRPGTAGICAGWRRDRQTTALRALPQER